ncbi:MAG: type II toxin-antitoxin system Phd/YefM family antitoxin [Stellaceae bacterium]
MVTVPATEFCKRFGHFQTVAQREPVGVVNHGRPTAYLISADEYEKFQAVRAGARQYLQVGALPEAIVSAIKTAKVHPKHRRLNKLLGTR